MPEHLRDEFMEDKVDFLVRLVGKQLVPDKTEPTKMKIKDEEDATTSSIALTNQ